MEIHFYEQKGNFNLLDSSDIETQWYVTLKNNDGSIVEVNGNRCQLFWREDGDQLGRYTMEDGLEYLSELSFEYGLSVWGTVNHKGQTIAFIKKYNQNKEDIVKQFEETRKQRIVRQIENLKKELERTILDSEANIDLSYISRKRQETLKKWITSSEERLNQYKEGTEMYQKELKTITGYKAELELLTK